MHPLITRTYELTAQPTQILMFYIIFMVAMQSPKKQEAASWTRIKENANNKNNMNICLLHLPLDIKFRFKIYARRIF